MSIFREATDKLKQIVQNHGPEITNCVKIATHALIPGGGVLVETLCALCDYTNEKAKDITENEVLAKLEELGNDQTHMMTLIEKLNNHFKPTLNQMSTMAEFNVPEEGLQRFFFQALEDNPVLIEVRSEMISIQSELETIKKQNYEVLEKLRLQGDVAENIQSVWDAINDLQRSASKEELKSDFMMYQSHFQSCTVQGQFDLASQALSRMKELLPQSDIIKMSAIYLESTRKNFDQAEKMSHTLSHQARQNIKVKKVTQFITALANSSNVSKQKRDHSGQIATQSTPLAIQEGQSIGDKGWRLVAMIGRGGMGEVWKARNTFGKEGAIKLMKSSLSGDSQFVHRFQSEIQTLDSISHPNVIDVLDWGEDRIIKSWYFVMPYIQGQSLRSRLNKGVMEEKTVRKLVLAIAEGLVACHNQGVIHRDIKPENIMLHEDTPILIDFGIAHFEDGISSGQTSFATGGYAPPEQLAGRQIGPEVDLYALGMVGVDCFGGWAKIPESLSDIFEKLTHTRPSRRGSAQDLINQLQTNTVNFDHEKNAVKRTNVSEISTIIEKEEFNPTTASTQKYNSPGSLTIKDDFDISDWNPKAFNSTLIWTLSILYMSCLLYLNWVECVITIPFAFYVIFLNTRHSIDVPELAMRISRLIEEGNISAAIRLARVCDLAYVPMMACFILPYFNRSMELQLRKYFEVYGDIQQNISKQTTLVLISLFLGLLVLLLPHLLWVDVHLVGLGSLWLIMHSIHCIHYLKHRTPRELIYLRNKLISSNYNRIKRGGYDPSVVSEMESMLDQLGVSYTK